MMLIDRAAPGDLEKARTLLASLERAEIKSTWCVIAPGYSREIIGAIRDAGHELAMHYDAMTEGLPWGEEEFEKQHHFLSDLLDRRPISNKNHRIKGIGVSPARYVSTKSSITLSLNLLS